MAAILMGFASTPVLAAVSVTLRWDPVTDPNVAGCKIYYGTVSHNYTQNMDVGDVNTATIGGLAENTTYYFAATTYDALGNQSGYSNEAIFKSSSAVFLPPTLNAPASMTIVENAGPQSVSLSGISSGSGQSVSITAISNNPGLIPNPQVNYASPNPTGSLSFIPAAGASGSAIITVIANNGLAQSNIITKTFTVIVSAPVVSAPNQSPTLDPIADVTLAYNSSQQAVPMTGLTPGTNENQGLRITATSSNPSIVPNPRATYNSRNSTGSLFVSPARNTNGTATITVVVDDGQPLNHAITNSFTVTVLPNQPPTLDPIANATLAYNSRQQTIPMTGLTPGTNENQGLRITATSSNPSIVPNPRATYNSRSSTGSLFVSPGRNTNGTATITVVVDDGQPLNHAITNSFTVTVLPNQPPTLDPIPDTALAYNSFPQTIPMTNLTPGTNENQSLRITVISSNPSVVPNPRATYNSRNSTGSLFVSPGRNTNGTATITVIVDDGQPLNHAITNSFTVTVLPNQQPTLDPIVDLTVPYNTALTNIALSNVSVGSPEENQQLRITAVSSNPKLVGNPSVSYNRRTGTGTLNLRPMRNTNGTAVITITLDDGSPTTNRFLIRTFSVTIAPENAPVVAQSAAPAMLTTPAQASGKFSFQVNGQPGVQYAVEASSDLVHWTVVQTNTAPFLFEDPDAAQYSQRFYRAVQLPPVVP